MSIPTAPVMQRQQEGEEESVMTKPMVQRQASIPVPHNAEGMIIQRRLLSEPQVHGNFIQLRMTFPATRMEFLRDITTGLQPLVSRRLLPLPIENSDSRSVAFRTELSSYFSSLARGSSLTIIIARAGGALSIGQWRTRVEAATRETQWGRRAGAYLRLINEAVAPDVGSYPELTFPVGLFRSDSAASHGGVYLNMSMPGSPGTEGASAGLGLTRTLEEGGQRTIFIMLGPAALHPGHGPVFTQRVLFHEYVHFHQNLRGELTQMPACQAAWRGTPVGGNPNREIVAVSTTFARFFPAWADTARPGVTDYPRYLLIDLAYMQAYFPCVTEQGLRDAAIARVVATVRGNPARRQHLQGMIQRVRARDLPSAPRPASDNAMAQLSSAMGSP